MKTSIIQIRYSLKLTLYSVFAFKCNVINYVNWFNWIDEFVIDIREVLLNCRHVPNTITDGNLYRKQISPLYLIARFRFFIFIFLRSCFLGIDSDTDVWPFVVFCVQSPINCLTSTVYFYSGINFYNGYSIGP